jgi:hypothetical protein
MIVKTTLHAEIRDEIAAQLCNDFLEWLDDNGMELKLKSALQEPDPRSYEELALTYVKSAGR